MSPDTARTPLTHYPCFESSIRLYQMFGFFSEVTPTTWQGHLIHRIPWLVWYGFTLSLALNVLLLVNNYLRRPNVDIKGMEIFQRAFEAFLAPLFLFEMRYFVTSYYDLVREMRRHFDAHCQAHCQAQERKVLIFSTVIVISNMAIAYYRKLFFGLLPDEIELVAYYYHKARPERQLPFVMWLPFDDTVDPLYYFAAVLNVYLFFLTAVLAIHINSCTLIFAVHLRGQFEMLALYLRNVGNPHLFVYKDTSRPAQNEKNKKSMSEQSNEPSADNIENTTSLHLDITTIPDVSSSLLSPNWFNTEDSSPFTFEDAFDAESLANLRRASAAGRNFERDCLVFIIRRHQYLINFRNRLESRFKVMIMSKMFTYMVVTVSLYQLSFVSALDLTAMQFVLQLLAAFSFSFVITHSSETLERGNEAMRGAALQTHWTRGLRLKHARNRRANTSTHARESANPSTHAQNWRADTSTHAQNWRVNTSTHAQETGERGHASTRVCKNKSRGNASTNARLLLVLLRMCDRPIRLTYYGGAITLCYNSFLGVLRFCYSLFTLLKRSIQVK